MDRDHEPATRPDTVVDQLLEESWESRERRGSRRELTVEAIAAVLFAGAAAALLLGSPPAHLVGPGTACLLIAIYAVVARIEFPVGAGHVIPTQLVLVPMLVILPPATVPLAVAAALCLSIAPDWLRGRVAFRRVLSAVPDGWHAIGPAAVLIAAGSPHIGGRQIPLVAAALAVSGLVDLASSMTRLWLAGIVVDWRVQLRVIAAVWVVDACLAPLGFLAGMSARAHPVAILTVLPLALLLWLLAQDRNKRIDQAHARLKLVEHERGRLRAAWATGRRVRGQARVARPCSPRCSTVPWTLSARLRPARPGLARGGATSGAGDSRTADPGGGAGSQRARRAPSRRRTAHGGDRHPDGSRPERGRRGADRCSPTHPSSTTEDVATTAELVRKAQLAGGEILRLPRAARQELTDALRPEPPPAHRRS